MHERANIRRMAGYVPGERPAAPAVKLNTNENPLAPGDAVMRALSEITPAMLQRYPDPLATRLRSAIADYHECGVDRVIVTNGSDELLRLAVTTFGAPGHAIGLVEPGYSLYGVLAQIQDCPVARVALEDDWTIPTDIAARWNEAGAKLALLANPQAPTGALLSARAIARLAAEFRGVLLVDEAYIDFVDPAQAHDIVSLIDQAANLLIVRTLSKGHSLAGLRLGYGLGRESLVTPMLTKVRDSYNVDVIAQHLGCAAFADMAHARTSWQLVREERDRVARELGDLGIVTLPSQANFLLADIPSAFGDAQTLHALLASQGVHVRWFDVPRLRGRLRISIGTRAENDELLSAIEASLVVRTRRAS
jgi:histidinol-phosphate aminotransferase